jgi:lysyl-tRNA synthetase class 1
MFWADELLKDKTGKQVVNDSWTPSGIIHMGGLKGPVIHDVLYRILKEKGADVHFQYGFDDMDPIDGLPEAQRETLGKYLGMPIYLSPAPTGEGTFGEYYGNIMRKLQKELGIKAEVYQTSILYKEGKFDPAIRIVLDNAQKVRDVYAETYKKTVAADWYPMQVVCPSCGKLGTTRVTGWDGHEVTYVCEPRLVTWAEGCLQRGKISPFGGNGKMPWKVEWAAKWWTFDVTVEGSGKDHGSAGGSYDIAMKICKDVFETEPPLKLVYEFFLSGGKKMSSSKGVGLNGEELLEVLTPEVARFLMIKTAPQTAVEFAPYGTNTIPDLYDAYQRAYEAYSDHSDELLARAFELSQLDEFKKPPTVRFSTLAQWVQMPNMEEKIRDEGLEEWAKYARVWVERFAPESDKFLIAKETPEAAKQLSEIQKSYLKQVAEELPLDGDAEAFQKRLYELSKEMGVPSKDAFGAIYTALIGKTSGPKAGWLILSLEKDFIRERFTSL